jgi:WD40 repeat protein/energy-coupling factor transporter ATP-binding protein EcfA2
VTTQTAIEDSVVGYPSLQALRLAHRELLARFERSSKSHGSVDEVVGFLQRAQQTGSVLEDDRERSAGQNILDYWVATLYRLRVEPPLVLLAPFAPRAQAPLLDARSPYPGLVPFEEEDRPFFYGRDAVVRDVCKQLEKQRVLVLTGPSGCGKSSLLRAGILPALKEGTLLPGSGEWRYFEPLIPGGAPLEALAELLVRELPEASHDAAALATQFRTDFNSLTNLLRPVGAACLVIDQVESVLPEEGTPIGADAHAFLSNLATLACDTQAACRLVVVCAEDGLTALSDNTAPIDTLAKDGPFGDKSRLPVPDLGTHELRDAVLEPARQIGLRFNGEREEIVSQLVRTLVGIPAVPPVLQFVMNRLWESRDERGMITSEDVEVLLYDPQRRRLNAGWALAQSGEAAYAKAGANPATARAMQSLLLRLVAPAPGAGVLLKRISLERLVRPGEDAGALNTALELLEHNHLLRRIEAAGSNEQHIELVHEALARLWQRLGRWIDDLRVTEARRERLQQCVDAWVSDNRSPERLWNEVQLGDIADLEDLSSAQAEFICRSRDRVSQVKRQERLRQRVRLGGLATIAALSVMVAGLAVYGYSLAQQQTQVQTEKAAISQQNANLQVARRLVSDSRTIAEDTPDLGLLLALEALRIDPSPATVVGLLGALERNSRLSSVLGAQGRVSAVGVSPDGSIVAAAHEDSVTLWDAPNFAQRDQDLRTTAPEDEQTAIALLRFSPRGTRLAASLTNGSVLVWDVATGELLGTLPHTAPVVSMAFGPTDDQLSTASLDGYVTTWDVLHSARISWRPLDGDDGQGLITSGSALSNDGSMLAVPDCVPPNEQTPLDKLCAGGIVRVWNTASGQLLWEQTGHEDGAISVVFNADGTRVTSGGADGSVIVWDNAQAPGTQLYRLTGHRNPVTSLAISPDGALLASGDCAPIPTTTALTVSHGCASGEIRIWSLETGGPIGPVQSQAGGVLNLAFLPNRALLASARASALLMWDTALLANSTPVFPASATSSIDSAILLPLDEGRLAAGGCANRMRDDKLAKCTQGGLRLLDSNGNPLQAQPPSVGVGQIVGLAASADGSRLASGGLDGALLLWDLKSMRDPTWLRAPNPPNSAPQNTWALAFGNQGQLAVNGNGGDVLTWDLEHGNQLSVLPGNPRQPVTALAFNPVTGQLVSGAQDGTVALWTGSGPDTNSKPLGVANAAVTALAVSPDGNIVAAASDDQTVVLWDTRTGLQIGNPLRSGPVHSLAIDHTGLHITTLDGHRTTLWDVDMTSTEALKQRACQIAHRNLTPAEWATLNAPAQEDSALCN